METWENFKEVIRQWAKLEITDKKFYDYCEKSEFENPIDRKLAVIFLKDRDRAAKQ